MERMNPTGLLVPTVLAASRAPPSVPSVRCSSTRAPTPLACTRIVPPLVPALATPPMLRRPDLSGRAVEAAWHLLAGREAIGAPGDVVSTPSSFCTSPSPALCRAACFPGRLDGVAVAKLPSCQIGELADETNPLRQCCRLARLLVVSVLSLPKNFRSKRTEVSMCYKTCKNFAGN